MASNATQQFPSISQPPQDAAMQHGSWRRRGGLSSIAATCERFLAGAAFDRAPWLAVSFASGIAAWFGLAHKAHWIGLIAGCLGAALLILAAMRPEGRFPFLRQSLAAAAIMVAAGSSVVWVKSALVGREPVARPLVATFTARIVTREEQPAEARARLVVFLREPESGRILRVRVNLPKAYDNPAIAQGAVVRFDARLMPPASPMLPGGYDFARAAWFRWLSATGSVLGPVEVLGAGDSGGMLARAQVSLSRHVRENIPGPAGAIAATLASGDRGAISEADNQAMRDSGLAHLLSISGLHVSALVGAAYLFAMRLLALSPWLAIRVRLPLVAAAIAALAGIAYTLLSGAEVPTVRSCIGAVLVLLALALGRDPLSMRMVAVAAFFVMLFWPEAVVGPSFQMSFAAVIAIVALHGCAPIKAFAAAREEGWLARGGRYLALLLLTGVVIELALMPIGLFHFHRSGIYGALANLIAIPLTTVVTMPLLALALVLDVAGAGAPAWWLAGKSLEFMLAMAHWFAGLPGAVKSLPAMGVGRLFLFLAGAIWLALWSGRIRLAGLVPMAAGALSLAALRPPDILVSGDGQHVGINLGGGQPLIVLREGRSGYARDNLTEIAASDGPPQGLESVPGARCNRDFCAYQLERGGRQWRLLLSRGRDRVPERALAAACARSDIVVANRWLPRSCRPAWLKLDRAALSRTGGVLIDLERGRITTVAQGQGDHGWWRVQDPVQRAREKSATPASAAPASAGHAPAAPASGAVATLHSGTAQSHAGPAQ
jgi:competence protein ComEC